MSSLAATFLNDFESSDGEDDDGDDIVTAGLRDSTDESKNNVGHNAGRMETDRIDAAISDNDDDDDDADKEENLLYIVDAKKASQVGALRMSNYYTTNLALITDASKHDVILGNDTSVIGNLEDDPEYKLILISNRMIVEMDDDISGTHRYLADIYSKKLPELESIVPNKMDYVRTVKIIGNETDMTIVDLSGILSPASVMIVSVTGSTTSGKPLDSEDLVRCMNACDEILAVEHDKLVIMQFVESRMSRFTPNLCALIGAKLSAQLVGTAGGLVQLSKIPSCNIQVVGKEQYNLAGLSNISINRHAGLLQYSDLVQTSPVVLRKKALKLIAAKAALMVKVDLFKSHCSGVEGTKSREEVVEKIKKWQEPPKAKTKKALPIPEEKKHARRGGKRVRKMKERFATTDLSKMQNKVRFSVEDGEYGDSAMGNSLGMVGSKDTGRIRGVQRKEVKLLSKKQKKMLNVVSTSTVNGLASSLVFNSSQGIELVKPNAPGRNALGVDSKKNWFDAQSGFVSAIPGNRGK